MYERIQFFIICSKSQFSILNATGVGITFGLNLSFKAELRRKRYTYFLCQVIFGHKIVEKAQISKLS